MVGVTLNFWLTFGNFFVFLLLFYIWKFFANKGLTSWKSLAQPAIWDTMLAPNMTFFKIYLTWQLFFIFTSKTYKGFYSLVFMSLVFFILIFYFLLIIYLVLLSRSNKYHMENEIHIHGCMWLNCILILFMLVDNFISFLMMVELISAIYFFFVLIAMKNKLLTTLKFKNLLSNYMWISFFTLVLLFFALILVAKGCGSLKFTEILWISKKTPWYGWQLLLISLLWKIGAPGFYFYKLEMYQYLPTTSLIVFSIASAFTSCFLLHFIFINCWPIFVNQQGMLITYILIYNIVMLSRGLKITSVYQFLALSAANTWSVLLLFYLI